MINSSISVSMPLPSAPYRGIEPFRFVDKPIYVAREKEIRKLVRLVTIYRGILFYGDSGVGKSSLINAGLVPALLDEGLRPERLRVQPVAGSEVLLERIPLTDECGPPFLDSNFAQPISGGETEPARVVWPLQAFADRIEEFRRTESDYASANGSPLVLIFDQFEEIVTLVEEAANTRKKFDQARDVQKQIVAQLISLLSDQGLAVKLIFSFREDYLAKIFRLFTPVPQLRDQTFRLTPLPETALHKIIRRPFESSSIPQGHFKGRLSDLACAALESAFKELSDSGYINPTEVQIACLALWKDATLEKRFVDEADHREAVRSLFGNYLDRALGRLDQGLRSPAIAALTRLVTSSGTRNIVSEDNLLSNLTHEENVSESDARRVLEALAVTARLVFRQTRGDTAFYEITSEFLIPWIRQKRQERELEDAQKVAETERARAEEQSRAAAAERILSKRARQWACVATLLLLFAIGGAAWAFTAQHKIRKAYDKIIRLRENVAALNKETKSLRIDRQSLQKAKSEAEIQLAEVNSIKDHAVVQAHKELNNLHQEKTALLLRNKRLSQQAGDLQRQIEEATSNVRAKVNQYQELARLSLVDPRARSQPLLSQREGDLLSEALGSLQDVQQSIADGPDEAAMPEIALLRLKGDIVVAILRSQLDSALAKCDAALKAIEKSADRTETMVDFLQLRGDILTQKALLVSDAAPTSDNYRQIEQLLDDAMQAYQQAQQLFGMQTVQACQNNLRIASVFRWMSFFAEENPKIDGFRAKAEQVLNAVLEDLKKLPDGSSSAVLAAKEIALRLSGNLIYDALKKNGIRKTKLNDLERAISQYQEAAQVGTSLLSQNGPGDTAEQTLMLGVQLFIEANLADCYHYMLAKTAELGTGADIGSIKTALKTALDGRIALSKKLLSVDRTNQYFRTLLAAGYFNRAKMAIEDKIPAVSEEEAQKNLRLAFCLALPNPQDDITNYFWDQLKKQRNPEAASRMKDLVETFNALNVN